MLVALLPTVSKLFKGKEKRLGLLGCLWTAIVAFSRLRMGAHFLSDGRDHGVARHAGTHGAWRVPVLFQQKVLPVCLEPHLRT